MTTLGARCATRCGQHSVKVGLVCIQGISSLEGAKRRNAFCNVPVPMSNLWIPKFQVPSLRISTDWTNPKVTWEGLVSVGFSHVTLCSWAARSCEAAGRN